jgi:hypothetical protein
MASVDVMDWQVSISDVSRAQRNMKQRMKDFSITRRFSALLNGALQTRDRYGPGSAVHRFARARAAPHPGPEAPR